MKHLFITSFVATAIASGAFAGSLDLSVETEPVVIAPITQITDWSGPYVGVLAASGGGTQDYTWTGDGTETWSEEDLTGTMYGAFAGINHQRGTMVFGVEGAYSMGSFGAISSGDGGEWGEELTSVIDLKARAGIAAGDALLYGFAGWSTGSFRIFDTWDEFDDVFTVNGLNYGVGADFFVTENIFVGGEYILRALSGATYPDETVDLAIQAAQLRIGMAF